MIEAYDRDPNEVAEWTFYQCRMVASSIDELKKSDRMTRAQHIAETRGIAGRPPRPRKVLKTFRRMGRNR